MTRARSRLWRWLLVLAVVMLAAGLRLRAARLLPVDFDEPTYFAAAESFAAAVRAGDLGRFVDADTAAEHPALAKLVYAAVLLARPAPPQPIGAPLSPMTGADGPALRLSAVALGVLHVLLLAAVSPLAGALLAVQGYAVKYTAQIYLEALPMLTATVCVLAYQEAHAKAQRGQGRQEEAQRQDAKTPGREEEPPRQERQEDKALLPLASLATSRPWREVFFLSVSAVALGLTAAGKYIYAVAGLAVAADVLWAAVAARRPRAALVLLPWGALALLVFLAANPNLWPDPPGRLAASLGYHLAYAGGQHVAEVGYPPWQPFVWLVTPQPFLWHRGIILAPLEPLIAALAVLGLRPTWRRAGGRVIVLWALLGLAFMLLWPTKWPQYSLVMTAPLCLCAAEGGRQLRIRN